MFQINFRSCNSSRPIRATLLKVVLSLSLSALLLISSPGLVLAEGETPPIPTESAPETSAGDDQDSSSSPPPTTEASKPFATEAAESDPNSQIVTDPVNESMTESTEPSASVTEVPDNAGTPSEVGSDSPPASEVVTQIEQAVLIPPLPDDVNLQVLDEVGQPLPLVTIVAAEILAAPDPFFTRGGTLVRYAADCTGLANCTVSAAPIQAAIDDVKTNGIPDDSTINVEAGTYNENVVIDNLGALQPLTLKGGVGGGTSTINGTLYIHDNIAVIEVNGFTITGGVSGNDNGGEVALKNLTITGNAASLGNGAAGIAFIDSSSFILDNVNSSNIPVVGGSGYGLAMNNINGAVEVENSTFDDNPDIGLLISDHIGTITITNVAASNNDGTGAYLHNPTSGDVSVSGSTFSGNGAGGGIYMDGLDVITSGSITLQNVTASNNANYGAYLDNCGWNGATCAGAGTGDVSVDPSTFSNNGSEGLVVHSADDIVVDQVTADNNWGSNVWLVTKNGAGAINITSSIFQGSPVALNCTTAERIAVTAGGVLVQINCTTSGGGGGVTTVLPIITTKGPVSTSTQVAVRTNRNFTESSVPNRLSTLIKNQILTSTLEDRVAWGMLESILTSALADLTPGNIFSNDPLGGVVPNDRFSNDPIGGVNKSSGGVWSKLKSEVEGKTGFSLQRGSRAGTGEPSSAVEHNLADILLAHGNGRYYSGSSSSSAKTPEGPPDTYPGAFQASIGNAWISLQNFLCDADCRKEEQKAYKSQGTAVNGVRGDCPADSDLDCGESTGGGTGRGGSIFDLPIRRPVVDSPNQCPDDRPKCVPEGAIQGIAGSGGGSDDDPEGRCDQDKRYCVPSAIFDAAGGGSGGCAGWECGGLVASATAEQTIVQKTGSQFTSSLTEKVKKNLQSTFVGGALLVVAVQPGG